MLGDRPPLHVADNLLLISHDRYTGKGKARELSIGLGLAAGLIGELVLYRRIELSPNTHTIVVTDRTPPPDPLAYTLLSQIVRENTVSSVRQWLTYVSQYAYHWTGDRLARSVPPVVREAQVRQGLLRAKTVTVYPPIDINSADLALVRIHGRIRQRAPVDVPDVLLAALVRSIGLYRVLVQDWSENDKRYLEYLVDRLPRSLGSLVAETTSAIGDAVLSHRL